MVQNVICGNITADTANIQAALDTGDPVHISGLCKINATLTITTRGQYIYGDGSGNTSAGNTPATMPAITTLSPTSTSVTPVFNCNLLGVTYPLNTAGPTFQDFIITGFASTNNVVGINCGSTTTDTIGRIKIYRVLITQVGTAAHLLGDVSGTVIQDFGCGAYHYCIQLDMTPSANSNGDTIRLDNVHCWDFGTTGPPYYTGVSATCIDAGYVSDLMINDLLSVYHQCVNLHSNFFFGQMSNSDCDTNNGVVMNNGTFTMSNMIFSQGTAGQQAISLNPTNNTGYYPRATLTGFLETNFSGVSSSTPTFQVGYGSWLTVSNGYYARNSAGAALDTDTPAMACSGNFSQFNITGVRFEGANASTMAQPVIVQTGTSCRITATGNRINDMAGGSGTFIKINNDDWHNATGNTAPGWSEVSPARTQAVYCANNPAFSNSGGC